MSHTSRRCIALAVLWLCAAPSSADEKKCPEVKVKVTGADGKESTAAARSPSTTTAPDDSSDMSEEQVLKGLIAQLKGSTDSATKAQGECLEDMLKRGAICVVDGEPTNGDAFADADGEAGWSGDTIIVKKKTLDDAEPGLKPGAGDPQKLETARIKALLSHEATHAGEADPDPPLADYCTNRGYKDAEKAAYEQQIKVLKACGYAADSETVKSLSDWLQAVCDVADANPTGKVDFTPDKCPKAKSEQKSVLPPGDESAFLAPEFMLVGTELRVCGTEEIEDALAVGVQAPAGIALFDTTANGAPSLAVLVVGANSSGTGGQTQVFEFDLAGSLLSTGPVVERAGTPFAGVARSGPPTSGLAYALADSPRRILPLTDSDADGVPDTVGPPFAAASAYDELAEVRHFWSAGPGHVVVTPDASLRENHRMRPDGGEAVHVLVDQNADGVADILDTELQRDRTNYGSPAFTSIPEQGDTAVAAIGNPGVEFEVWSATSLGTRVAQLGEAVAGPGSRFATVPLAQPLAAGDRIVLFNPEEGYVSYLVHVGQESNERVAPARQGELVLLHGRISGGLAGDGRIRMSGRLTRNRRARADSAGGVVIAVSDGGTQPVALAMDDSDAAGARRGSRRWRSGASRVTANLETGRFRAVIRGDTSGLAATGRFLVEVEFAGRSGASSQEWRPCPDGSLELATRGGHASCRDEAR